MTKEEAAKVFHEKFTERLALCSDKMNKVLLEVLLEMTMPAFIAGAEWQEEELLNFNLTDDENN